MRDEDHAKGARQVDEVGRAKCLLAQVLKLELSHAAAGDGRGHAQHVAIDLELHGPGRQLPAGHLGPQCVELALEERLILGRVRRHVEAAHGSRVLDEAVVSGGGG